MVKRVVYFFALFFFLSAPMAWVLGATVWMGPTYDLTLPHVTQSGQSITGGLDLALQHDGPCDVTIHPLRAGGEVLTGPGGATLKTSYKLTGAAILVPDADWVESADFRVRAYHIQSSGPTTDVLRLEVKGESPTGGAVPAGDYTTSFALTVTW